MKKFNNFIKEFCTFYKITQLSFLIILSSPFFANHANGVETLDSFIHTALANNKGLTGLWNASQAYNVAMGNTFLDKDEIVQSKICDRPASIGKERQALMKAALFSIVIRPNGSQDMQVSTGNLKNYEIDHYLNMRICEGIGRDRLGYKNGIVQIIQELTNLFSSPRIQSSLQERVKVINQDRDFKAAFTHMEPYLKTQQSEAEKFSLALKIDLEFPNGDKFNTVEEFLQKASTNQIWTYRFMRQIPLLAERLRCGETGFYLNSNKYSDDRSSASLFSLSLQKPSIGSSPARIEIKKVYNFPKEYQQYKEAASFQDSKKIDDFLRKNPTFDFNPSVVRFSSLSGNLLIVPRKSYTSIYDFSHRASAEEILDLWKMAYHTFEKFTKDSTVKWFFKLAAHSGSNAAQTIAQFHLRLEKK